MVSPGYPSVLYATVSPAVLVTGVSNVGTAKELSGVTVNCGGTGLYRLAHVPVPPVQDLITTGISLKISATY
jgi:hypothetical protein